MRLLVAVVLAGCASHAASGPAWPKLHEAEKDGGESLTPHVANSAVAAVEKGGNEEETAKPVAAPAAAPVAAPKEPGAAAPATAPVATPSDDPILTDDIVIEIDD